MTMVNGYFLANDQDHYCAVVSRKWVGADMQISLEGTTYFQTTGIWGNFFFCLFLFFCWVLWGISKFGYYNANISRGQSSSYAIWESGKFECQFPVNSLRGGKWVNPSIAMSLTALYIKFYKLESSHSFRKLRTVLCFTSSYNYLFYSNVLLTLHMLLRWMSTPLQAC